MSINRVLLFYISINSGHQMAAMAIEDGIRIVNREIETLNINHFSYTNPVLAKVVMKTYHSMLKRTPELWDYLYDNDKVKRKISKFRGVLYKLNTAKIHRLMEWFQPEIVVCTQAFPCVAMAEYKRVHKKGIPIVGVVTDYGIHSYWIDDGVDLYIVPNKEGRDRLVELGIQKKKIELIGIPVLPKFSSPLDIRMLRKKLDLNFSYPVVLLMGGSRGMISMDEIVEYLVKLPFDMQILVVCGANKMLYRKLQGMQKKIKSKMHIYGYVNNVEELMSVSDLIVTKPGGLTVTEALAKKLPMVIVNPIPGQEAKNTEFLIRNNVAVQAKNARDVARQVGDLLSSHDMLLQMKENISVISKPDAVIDIVERIINWSHN